MTEDEMAGWHHRLNGHEFEQAPRVGEGLGSLGMLLSVGSQRVTQQQQQGRLSPEKGMAVHSSILAQKIPWTEEPGGLQPTGSQRIRHE